MAKKGTKSKKLKNNKKIVEPSSKETAKSKNTLQKEQRKATGKPKKHIAEKKELAKASKKDLNKKETVAINTQDSTDNNKSETGRGLNDKSNLNNYLVKNKEKVVATAMGILASVVILWSALIYIPEINESTEDTKEFREEQQREQEAKANEAKIAEEDEFFQGNFDDKDVLLKTNFGNIKINLKHSSAPQTVENFLRLSHRDYYTGTKFHKIVKDSNFGIIQGGDPNSKDNDPTNDGKGGASAFGEDLKDEIWEVSPKYDPNSLGKITNDPIFSDPDLYGNLNKESATTLYRKGLIVMAKNSQPDSATSQFFLTFKDTVLPAQYTVFGVVEEESHSVLDKIDNEITPVPGPNDTQNNQEGSEENISKEVTEGIPDKEIIIENIEILTKS